MRIHLAGGGHCNEYIARRLIHEGHDLVLVEKDGDRCQALVETLDARVIQGDAGSMKDWKRAGLEDSEMFLACTDSDSVNIQACLIANDLAPDAKVVMRIRTDEHHEWQPVFERLGLHLDRVVHPESDMAARILRMINVPGVADIHDFADGAVRLFSMNLEQQNPLSGSMVGDLATIIGPGQALVGIVFRGNESVIPDGSVELLAGDQVHVVTSDENMDHILNLLGVRMRKSLNKVFIVGGGEVGLELARSMEAMKISVKLFEEDPARCEYLASELTKTIVINADGTNQDVLLQEDILDTDAFISLTGTEDANLIACLLARRLGVEKVIPLVDSINYLQLAQRLGINTIVNPRVKAADAIFEYVRKGRVLSVRTLGEEAVEAIELVVSARSVYVDIPLRDLQLPEGCLVGAISRPDNGVIIPDGDSRIHAGDRVVFFIEEGAVKELENRFLDTGQEA